MILLMRPRMLVVLFAAGILAACAERTPTRAPTEPGTPTRAQAPAAGAKAVFAAGCFWCVEEAFEAVEGVREVRSGYTGGNVPNPSYREVTTGRTGHYEAVEVTYDPNVVDYATLLSVFWRNVDPTDDGGQFCDRGSSYLGAIFPVDDAQRALAEASRAALVDDPEAPKPIVTPILDGAPFYLAEDYHQDYYRKNPIRYRYYKGACGRSDRLEAVWGDYRPGSVLADGASG